MQLFQKGGSAVAAHTGSFLASLTHGALSVRLIAFAQLLASFLRRRDRSSMTVLPGWLTGDVDNS